MVRVINKYCVIAALFFTSVIGDDKDGKAPPATPVQATSGGQVVGVDDTGSDSARVRILSTIIEYVRNNKYFKLYFGPLKPLDIPDDLTGVTDAQLMGYVAQLRRQRRTLKRRMALTMSITSLSLVSGYVLSKLMLPVVALVESQNANFALTLDTEWMVYQHKQSAFLWEYIRVRRVDVKTLRKSWLIDCRRVRLEYAPGFFTTFPLWTSDKDEQLPATANIRSNLAMLKHWYLSRR